MLAQAAEWAAHGANVVLASVASAWGSAPRGVGSHLAVAADGTFVGSVSGGCVEAAVISAAESMLRDGPRVRLMDFGVADETAWSIGLPCGGTIKIVLAVVDRSLLAPLQTARSRGQAVALVVDLSHQQVRLVDSASADRPASIGPHWSGLLAGGLFVRSYTGPARMVIVGAVHVAQTLVTLATEIGFKVTVIDPRRRFADMTRFPGTTLCQTWPDEVFRETPLTADSALCVLSHEPRIDDPALLAALASPAFYIGALGSRRSHRARLDRLAAAGADSTQLERIRGPIGLDIGAFGPAEIAVATMAEIIATYRRPPAGRGDSGLSLAAPPAQSSLLADVR